jgi:hypothetical protein
MLNLIIIGTASAVAYSHLAGISRASVHTLHDPLRKENLQYLLIGLTD